MRGLFDGLDPKACRACGRPASAEGLCSWCIKGPVMPPSVRGAPSTSHAAAVAFLPKAGSVRRCVFDAIAKADRGMTEEEIEMATGLSGNTVRPRVWELCGKNGKADLPALIRDSGRRKLSRAGRECVVWEVIP